MKKLLTAEASVESLNAQLSDVISNESLSREKNQHDAIVTSLQQKFESELLTLRQKLDLAARDLQEKVFIGNRVNLEIEKLEK